MTELSGWAAATALICTVAIAALQLPFCRFAEEEITIDVWPRQIRVTGLYRYENVLPIPIRQGLLIPLPVDADHPEPFEVSVGRPAHIVRLFGAYRCDLTLKSGATALLLLRYRQFAPLRNARYILTTTRPWRLPLRTARYRIVPHDVTITGSNYALHRTNNALEFARSDFLPHHDWQFSWR